jgi:hypothetical protein
MHSTPHMADEPAASACPMPQTTDEDLEDATGQRVSELELESTRTDIVEQCRPASPSVDPTTSCEAKTKIDGIKSSAKADPTPQAQNSQDFSHGSTSYDILEPVNRIGETGAASY